MDRVWIVKRTGYCELCLVNIVHGGLALRVAQAHLDALKSVVHDDDSLVSEKSELKCGGRETIFPDMTGGVATLPPKSCLATGGRLSQRRLCAYPKSGCSSHWSLPGRICVVVKACAIRAAYLLGIRKSFERSPRDDRIFSEVTYPSTGSRKRETNWTKCSCSALVEYCTQGATA
jgi:hypothetical protein